MRLPFILIAAGLAVAVILSAPLAWDGSYWLFKTLDLQVPYVSNGRYSNILLEAPAAAAAYLTDNFAALRILFGAPYASVPLIALAASWWVVRDRASGLFLWAVLGIVLATLPGQLCFVCEGSVSAQLFWPVFLAVLVGMPRRALPVAAFLVLFLFFLHPVAILLFLTGIGASVAVAIVRKEWRKRLLVFAVALLAIALLGALRLQMSVTPYEGSQLSLDVQLLYFSKAVAGLPLAALLAAWLSGLFILTARHAGSERIIRVLRFCGLAGLALSGVILLVWAMQPEVWRDALLFKTFAFLSVAPFMFFAFVDVVTGRWRADAVRSLPVYDRTVMTIVSLLFFLVLATQSILFDRLARETMDQVAAAPGTCVERSSLTAARQTVLDHWSLPLLVFDLQGRAPQKLVLDDAKTCLEAASTGPLPLVPWETQGTGWFDFQPARDGIEIGGPCVMTFSSGAYQVERAGADWWVWMARQGRLLVFVQQPIGAAMTASLNTAQRPNRVGILLNGEQRARVDMVVDGFQPLESIPLALRAGDNLIEFNSDAPAAKVHGDDRWLAAAVVNLLIVLDDGKVCRLIE